MHVLLGKIENCADDAPTIPCFSFCYYISYNFIRDYEYYSGTSTLPLNHPDLPAKTADSRLSRLKMGLLAFEGSNSRI